ncbi:hypothetical protein BEWA_042330 [Theileria equi strain WA]|uniref:Uncharacterized protein n=1 Tax=Theileria equi strain WA TaxID=1537102 RepID=L1LG05_THEEQ|nr:hypothetical protein BEWA_042330 [Theileria equi strain WA]EKX74195.1 hypothetical protein BEWA_042330 [Theileria equi strain WA]|eukprot:XP_004833647.1 hypothetical protein BEWA_042330 [Theileria equi strain WA]
MEKFTIYIDKNPGNTLINVYNKDGRHYYDIDDNKVILTEDSCPDGLEIYKAITHSLQNGAKIKCIKQKDQILSDFNGEYDSVSVCYWMKDSSYEHPLLIHVKCGNSHAYFANNGDNTWKKIKREDGKDTEQLKGKLLDKKLDEINCNVNSFIYIDISRTYKYPYNSYCTSTINVIEDNSMVEDGFVAYEHLDNTRTSFGINRFWNGEDYVKFATPSLTVYSVSKVVVWFWIRDIEKKNPLLICIKSGNTLFYYSHSTNELWSTIQIRVLHISRVLDLENCRRNNAHILDISDYTTNAECTVCQKELSRVLKSKNSCNYTTYSYSPKYSDKNNISIAFFVVFDTRQIGLPVVSGLRNLSVYYYPKVKGIPLLISFQSQGEEWYERTNLKNVWRKVYDKDALRSDDWPNSLLPELLTKIAINLEITTGTYVHLGETVYVEKDEIEGYYCKFTHKLKGEYPFIMENITHNRASLAGIPTSDPILSVSVVYWTESFDFDVPLLVILKNCDDKLAYYINNEDIWKPFNGAEYDIRGIVGQYNCELNGVHALDISKMESYKCLNPTCSTLISVRKDISKENIKHGFIKCTSTCDNQDSFSVHTFTSNNVKQDGIALKDKIYEFCTYFCTENSGSPALIYFSSPLNCWYRRTMEHKNDWEVVDLESQPINENDIVSIQRNILIPISPCVTIETDKILRKGGVSKYYDYEAEVEIQFTEKDTVPGYHKYVHEVQNGTFILKHTLYENIVIEDVISEDPLDSVSVFYASNDSEKRIPLLLELSTFYGACTYYEENMETKMWTAVPLGSISRLDGKNLADTLDQIYKRYFPVPSCKIFLGICGAAGALGLLWNFIPRIKSEKKFYQKINMLTYKLLSKRYKSVQ